MEPVEIIISDYGVNGGQHRIRLIETSDGYFIDIRKFFFGHPSVLGIRMKVDCFKKLMGYLKEDIDMIEKEETNQLCYSPLILPKDRDELIFSPVIANLRDDNLDAK